MKKLGLLLIFFLPLCLFAQDLREIKGKVIDKITGDALPGASVYIDKSTVSTKTSEEGMIQSFTLGTTTDIDGNFTIHVPKNLKFLYSSFVSYDTQKVLIEGKDYVVINLETAAESLQDVVVTGYQTIERRKLTSSVVKISTDKILQGGVSSVDQMLGGQLAGVQTTNISGAPGAPAKIRIRGTASLSGSQDPLWVLDGMPLSGTDVPDMSDTNIDQLVNSSIAGLNPNDIADITILKDAAATAIYGARAANGVIVITTKKGKKGKMKVSFTTNTSFVMRPDMSRLNLMNSNDKVDFELQMAARKEFDIDYNNSGKGSVTRILDKYNQKDAYRLGGFSSISNQAKQEINALRAINTDWGKELYQTATNQEQSLSISGGTDKANYYFSTGYYNEKGTTIGTGMERFNLTMKSDYQIFKNLNIGASVFYNKKNQESYLTGTDSFTNPSRYSRTANPYLEPKNKDGEYVYDQEINGYSGRHIPFSFMEERENTSNELKSNNLNAVFDLNLKLDENLKFHSQLGLQISNSDTEQFADINTYNARKAREKSRFFEKGKPIYFIPEGGVLKTWNSTDSQWNWKNMLEYNISINDVHEIDMLLGSELRRAETKRIMAAAYGFDKQSLTSQPVTYHAAGNEKTFPLFRKSFFENAYASFFGTIAYTYNKKYTLFGSVRMDGSDLFGVDPKYRYLPLWAASGAWIAKEEDFLKDSDFISDLKFRASYGLQGNIDKSTSPYIVGEVERTTLLPGNNEKMIKIVNPPNDLLRWEKTASWNAGIDLGLFKNIIRISADVYDRTSTDLVGVKAIQLENGFATTSLNWASLTNRGFELSIVTRNVYTEDFRWSTNFNISKNINEVTKLHIKEGSATPSILNHSVNSLFAIKTAGFDKDGYPLFEKGGKKVTAVEYFDLYDPYADFMPGEIVNTKLSNEELAAKYECVGSRDPELSGGFINNFTYKNLSLNISCAFNINQWVKVTPPYLSTSTDRGMNGSTDLLKGLDRNNGQIPVIIGKTTPSGVDRSLEYNWYGSSNAIDTYRDLDIWYKKMSFLRVSSIRLSYKLPVSLLKKCGLESAKINMETRNPFVVGTNYDGYFDPETYGNIYAQPISKSVTLGLNITF